MGWFARLAAPAAPAAGSTKAVCFRLWVHDTQQDDGCVRSSRGRALFDDSRGGVALMLVGGSCCLMAVIGMAVRRKEGQRNGSQKCVILV